MRWAQGQKKQAIIDARCAEREAAQEEYMRERLSAEWTQERGHLSVHQMRRLKQAGSLPPGVGEARPSAGNRHRTRAASGVQMQVLARLFAVHPLDSHFTSHANQLRAGFRALGSVPHGALGLEEFEAVLSEVGAALSTVEAIDLFHAMGASEGRAMGARGATRGTQGH